MLRRLLLTAAATIALAAVVPAASADPAVPSPRTPRLSPLPVPLLTTPDTFAITVSDPASSRNAGTYKLRCGPADGTHPKAQAACDRLAQLAVDGRDPFAPVPQGTMCTMQHGGEATARVTGSWQGRNIDAAFNRKNGCEISRWRTLEPVLPSIGS
jgi:hypothetical protein